MRTHERPVSIGLHTLHEEIGDPESVEEIASSLFVFSGVLPAVQEIKHVRMPRLKVDGKGTRALWSKVNQNKKLKFSHLERGMFHSKIFLFLHLDFSYIHFNYVKQ